MIWPRVDAAPSPPIPVLIQRPGFAGRTARSSSSRRDAEALPRTKRLGRRRLRREVRLTAYASWQSSASAWPGGSISPTGLDRTQAAAIGWTWPRWCLPAGPSGSREHLRGGPIRTPSPESCSRSSRSGQRPNRTRRPRSSFPDTCCPKTLTRSRRMREVDEALSRAYARRGLSGSASSLPPTPHCTEESRPPATLHERPARPTPRHGKIHCRRAPPDAGPRHRTPHECRRPRLRDPRARGRPRSQVAGHRALAGARLGTIGSSRWPTD